MKSLCFVVCLFRALHPSWTQTFSTEMEYQILEEHLGKDYNVNHAHEGGADVYVQLRLNSVGRLDEENMEYSIDLTIRQRWNDSRLAYNKGDDFITVQDPKMRDRIWKPDTYFLNARKAQIHQVTMPNILFRLEKTGEILYVLRMKMTVECELDFHSYPLDNQRCGLILASYSNTVDKLRYHWGSGTHFKMPGRHSFPQFDLYSNKTENEFFSYTIGNFSGLVVSYDLRRRNGYYILHVYIPTFLIVTMSWVSFWIDPTAVPGRVTLGVTTVLTLTTLSGAVGYHLPPVSYVKALDIWLAVCMSMVYASLLEFTMVNYLANKKMRVDEDTNNAQKFEEAPTAPAAKKPTTYISQARAVDRLSRLIFPSFFLLFNIVYWPYYVTNLYKPTFSNFSEGFIT